VDGLEELSLDLNNIHRLTLSSVPSNLERLELQNNLIDLMPDFPDAFEASRLVYLYVVHVVASLDMTVSSVLMKPATCSRIRRNLSRNYLWSITTNDALGPYTGLVTLYVCVRCRLQYALGAVGLLTFADSRAGT
jgi:Leucine-rich repeat (LRR) protein